MSTATEVITEKRAKRKSSKKDVSIGSPIETDSPQPSSSTPSKKRKRDEKDATTASTSETLPTSEPSDEIIPDIPESADAEATVLSHAQARKERKAKKHQPAHSSASPEAGKTTKTAKASTSNAKAAAQKRQNSVWVGNLSFKTTAQQLEEFFQFAGKITRVNLPTKNGEGGKPANRG